MAVVKVMMASLSKEILMDAIHAGSREFEISSFYGAVEVLAEAMEESVNIGLVNSPDDFYIVAKISMNFSTPDAAVSTCESIVRKLGLTSLDLFLLHSSNPMPRHVPFDEVIMPWNTEKWWAAMETCKSVGLVNQIGVSNFSTLRIDQVLKKAVVTPAVNQVELRMASTPGQMKFYCDEKGIGLMVAV